ncbi:hypothetical protein EZV73_19215 [Acidaminobacter sp. JC074]|uniref:hypothetical protein n=1 Tax=Acidaminobacter sp. JC074 TaxID=2530199 RepID=UPI001F1048AE|nr:hypothetical protein [Acidaminobacter sp. JC074]MCH4889721.1 hypothetical protein [Acidaminobacter sp. JC074]
MNKLDNKGMTSILVLVFMTVILLLGISTVIASLSNQKLANKKETWQVEYYELETLVQRQLVQVDETLKDLSINPSFANDFIRLYPDAYEEKERLIYEFQVENDDSNRGISVMLSIPLEINARYEILAYYEFSAPFEYNQKSKFEDPF